jgi:signal transduction histidine kinase
MRILIAAFVMIGGVTIGLEMVGVLITRQFMYTRFQDRIAFLAKYLALNSEVGVLIADKEGLSVFARNLLSEKDVGGVAILDNQDNELVNLNREMKGPFLVMEAPVLFKRTLPGNLLFEMSAANSPLQKNKQIEEIGKVVITYSTAGIDKLMVEIARKFFWASVIAFVIAGIVFFFISRSIVVELTGVVEIARAVGNGNLSMRANPGSLPETTELALAFNSMLDSIEKHRINLEAINREMNRQKNLAEMGKFSLMIAHEVKNPLGIIKSSLDVLKKELNIGRDNLMVDYIEDEIRRLNALIEDFLLFARPATPAFRQVDVNGLVRDIVDRFRLQMDNTPVEIILEIPDRSLEIVADPDLIARALNNIIRNAVEASGACGGEVRVRAAQEGEMWDVEVRDQGGGIPLSQIDQVFDPFFTTKSGGTGLGLAFAVQVAKAHGGMIQAANNETGGALFTFSLPIQGHSDYGTNISC